MIGRTATRREYAGLPWLIGAMLVAFVTVGALSLFYLEKQLISTKGQALALAAADIADKLDLFLNNRVGDLQVLAGSRDLRTNDPATLAEQLYRRQQAYPIYLWLAAADASGRAATQRTPSTAPASPRRRRSGSKSRSKAWR